ncbi:unnamed protein product, partial [Closterium sp. Naga37s-1]
MPPNFDTAIDLLPLHFLPFIIPPAVVSFKVHLLSIPGTSPFPLQHHLLLSIAFYSYSSPAPLVPCPSRPLPLSSPAPLLHCSSVSYVGPSFRLSPPPLLLSSPTAFPPLFSCPGPFLPPSFPSLPLLWSLVLSIIWRTTCIGLAPSAMARMTAVAMLLPGLLAAFLPAVAVIVSIMPLARDAWPFTTAKDVSGAMLDVSGAMLDVSGAMLDVSGAMLDVSGAMLDVPCDSQQAIHPLMLTSASLPLPNATTTCQSDTSLLPTQANAIATSLQHVHALNVPLHSLHTLYIYSCCILFCYLHSLCNSRGTAVVDGRDSRANHSMGAAGLGCGRQADATWNLPSAAHPH